MRFAYSTTTSAPMLTVLDLAGGPAYSLAVDPGRAPYGDTDALDPAWGARDITRTRGARPPDRRGARP